MTDLIALTDSSGDLLTDPNTGAILVAAVDSSITSTRTLWLPVNCALAGQQSEPGKLDSNNNPLALKLIFGES